MSNDHGNDRRWEASGCSESNVASITQFFVEEDVDTISLGRFIAEQRKLLERFETYWIEQRLMDPDSETFPEEMREPDWIEQLEFFRDITDKNLG